MNYGRAFGAGVVGGLVMTILMFLGRLGGVTQMNLEMALGSLLTRTISPTTWTIGLIVHLIISGIIACIYALGFEYVVHHANWRIGVGFSVIHLIIGGLLLGLMENMHPLMTSPPTPTGHLMTPGVFASNFGAATVVAFIILHLIYGAIVGGMYRVTTEHHPGVPSPA